MVSAYCRETKRIVRIHVGSRTNKTLNRVLISLELSHDNVLWSGKVLEETQKKDEDTRVLKEYNALLSMK